MIDKARFNLFLLEERIKNICMYSRNIDLRLHFFGSLYGFNDMGGRTYEEELIEEDEE